MIGLSARNLDLLQRLDRAMEQCARHKASRPDAQAFRLHRAERMLDLAERLTSGNWRPAPGLVFVTTRPKHREVHAARFSDRVVHHLIADAMTPELERRLVPATFACRVGKGTHAAVEHLQQWIRRLGRNGQVRVWALQLDVVNFFHRIDRQRLWQHLQPVLAAVQRAQTLPFDLPRTVAALLADEPAQTAIRVGPARGFDRVPPHKRLAQAGVGIGLPIGNLTSQWFANAYLDPLDQFVMRTLGLPGYVRYMDDVVVLSTDRDRLARAGQQIHAFVQKRLGLQLHERHGPVPASGGIDFCGAIVRGDYLLPRRRVIAAWRERCLEAARTLGPLIVPQGRAVRLGKVGLVHGPCAIWPLQGLALAQLRQQWTSGRGSTNHGACRKLVRRAARSLPVLGRWTRQRGRKCVLRVGDPQAERGLRLWPHFAAQRRSLLAQSTGAVLLVQVGRRIEALQARHALACGWTWPRHRATRGAGVRVNAAGPVIDHVLAKGGSVAVALEHGGAAGAVRNRVMRWWIEPLQRTAKWWQHHTGTALATDRGGRHPWPLGGPWQVRQPASATQRTLRGGRPPSCQAKVAAPAAAAPPVAYSCDERGQYLLPWDRQATKGE